MKQFVKRLACGVLAIATMGTLVGCSREAPSTTESSDRAPVGYKAIAAMHRLRKRRIAVCALCHERIRLAN